MSNSTPVNTPSTDSASKAAATSKTTTASTASKASASSETPAAIKPGRNRGRLIAIGAVVAAFIALVFCSILMHETPADKAWTKGMTVGPENASRLYVMYTDIMCPYCDVFSRAALEHWDEFTAFLDEHNILFEIRLTDYLFLTSNSEMSRNSAEAGYCASREDKFWDYYHAAITALWKDYHSKGIGSDKNATPIKDMPKDYWLKVAHSAGLGDTFDSCMANRETEQEVISITSKATKFASGMPTFKFEKFSTSGFDNKWGWDYVKMYLEAGL